MAKLEDQYDALEPGALRKDIGFCREEVNNLQRQFRHETERLGGIFDARFDRLNAKVDEDIRGVRKLLYGTFLSVVGGAIFVAISAGLHPG